MAKSDAFPESHILSVSQFLQSYQTGCRNNEHFCFILGSGASVDSGIPMGGTMENRWMECLMGEKADLDKTPPKDPKETRKLAKQLKAEGKLEYDFRVIETTWKKLKQAGSGTLSSAYYFDLYKIRFHPNHRNGYYYLENLMADKEPSFGYHTLAELLTDGRGNNLVITTNFDSLMEDALFLYSKSKPLVVNHELLADYIGNHSIRRPIIAKVHRGMFFDPLNDPDETKGLKDEWHEVLQQAFNFYTPVVLGYGGGDHSLMDFLCEEKTNMPNGIYWCYMEEYGLPGESIQKMVLDNGGWLVRMKGFDSIMLSIGNALYPDKIGAHETELYLTSRNNDRITKYDAAIKALLEKEKTDGGETPAEEEHIEAVEEFKKREEDGQLGREKKKELTAWDWNRMGTQFFNKRDYAKAIEYYDMAIALSPEVGAYYASKSAAYDYMGNYEDALREGDIAVHLEPGNERALNNRGCAYIHLGRMEEGKKDLTAAIKLNPNFANPHRHLGDMFRMLGNFEEAVDSYSTAIEFNPDYLEAYEGRAMAYEQLGKHKEATADTDRAKELREEKN